LGNKSFWENYLQGKVPTESETVGFDEVFVPHRQTGIALNRKQVIDEMFYVKTSYGFDKGYAFGVIVEAEESIFKNGTITIGAEGSLFALEVHSVDRLQDHPVIAHLVGTSTPPDSTTVKKTVALSHAIFTDKGTSAYASFALVPYFEVQRMLKLNGTDKSTYQNFKGKTDPKRLVPPGSVLYDPTDSLPQAPGVFGQIGYNTFITAQGE
jgi:CRISPR/Cas system CMR-associated protein Cmr3 (group 5 of RAMP superfamily)